MWEHAFCVWAALLINDHTFNHSATAKSNGEWISISIFDLTEVESNSFRVSLSSWFVPRYSTNSQPKMIIYLERRTEVLPAKSFCFCQPTSQPVSQSAREWNKFIRNSGLRSSLYFIIFWAFAFLFRTPDSRQLKQIDLPVSGTKSLSCEWHSSFDAGHFAIWRWPKHQFFFFWHI